MKRDWDILLFSYIKINKIVKNFKTPTWLCPLNEAVLVLENLCENLRSSTEKLFDTQKTSRITFYSDWSSSGSTSVFLKFCDKLF